MMTTREQEFIDYWEKNRLREKNFFRQLAWGGGSGLLFIAIILLNAISGWNKQVTRISPSLLIILLLGMLAIAGFYGVIKMRIRWDKREAHYQSLKLKYTHENKK